MSLVWHHCALKDPQRTLQTTEEKIEHRITCDGVFHTTETAEQKEHRLSNPKTKIKQGMLLVQLLGLSCVAKP